ncbi:tyrosine-type recombinase/integrase [Bosea eneae]|uniref:Tyrosine-type recombinase/integrase n=1 Tax=Bosea eneae TaxID=151454 RepID=A0ABW0IWH6_9HYPH
MVAIASEGSYDPLEKRTELRPATQQNLRQVLGFFLGYLDRCHPASLHLPLAQSLTRQTLEGFMADLAKTNKDGSVLTLMERLKALCVRADLKDAAAIIAEVAGSSPTRGYIPPPRASARQVYRSAKAFFLVRVREIRRLGMRWRERARARRAASEALTALVVMLLTQLPLRIKNVLSLDLGNRLIVHEADIVIYIPGEEMKGGQDFNAVLGKELGRCVRLYLEFVRPILCSANSPKNLFLGAKGGALSYPTAYSRIRKLTERLCGEKINPHSFRRLVAVWARGDRSLGAEVAWRQLQHADQTQTDRVYAPARVEFGRHVYQAALKQALQRAARLQK